MHFEAAIFDMDGTLINSLILWDVFWTEFGKRFLQDANFRPREEDDKAVRTMTMDQAMALIHEQYHMGKNAKELEDVANAMMVDFYKNRVEMKSGVREFLDKLKASGTKMCIASASAPNLINMAMQRCDLFGYFEKVFSCGDIGKGKDQPDVFVIAEKYLGAGIDNTWVFEDSLTAIETAHAAGFKTVAIYDENNYGQEQMAKIADHYIAKGETLMKLLEE